MLFPIFLRYFLFISVSGTNPGICERRAAIYPFPLKGERGKLGCRPSDDRPTLRRVDVLLKACLRNSDPVYRYASGGGERRSAKPDCYAGGVVEQLRVRSVTAQSSDVLGRRRRPVLMTLLVAHKGESVFITAASWTTSPSVRRFDTSRRDDIHRGRSIA